MAKEKLSLEQVMSNINKKAGANIAHVGLEKQSNYKRIPFTSPRMNYCTYGGLPTGRLIEFYGEEHGGKTTSALDALANYQQIDDRKALYIDVEVSLDVEWAEKLGVDLSKVIIIQPEQEGAEDLFQMAIDFMDTGDIGLVIIDSIGAMVSNAELDKDIADKTYGGVSMGLTRFAKEATQLCNKRDCTVIGINQERDDMNAMWAGASRTVGGRNWKYMCSVRLCFKRGSFLNDKGEEIKQSSESPAGTTILMTMIKNKTCPPNRRGGFYSIDFALGINYLRDLVDVATKYDMIQKSGAWFTIVDPDTGEVKSEKLQGITKVYDFLKDEENEAILTFIEEYIDRQI